MYLFSFIHVGNIQAGDQVRNKVRYLSVFRPCYALLVEVNERL